MGDTPAGRLAGGMSGDLSHGAGSGGLNEEILNLVNRGKPKTRATADELLYPAAVSGAGRLIW